MASQESPRTITSDVVLAASTKKMSLKDRKNAEKAKKLEKHKVAALKARGDKKTAKAIITTFPVADTQSEAVASLQRADAEAQKAEQQEEPAKANDPDMTTTPASATCLHLSQPADLATNNIGVHDFAVHRVEIFYDCDTILAEFPDAATPSNFRDQNRIKACEEALFANLDGPREMLHRKKRVATEAECLIDEDKVMDAPAFIDEHAFYLATAQGQASLENIHKPVDIAALLHKAASYSFEAQVRDMFTATSPTVAASLPSADLQQTSPLQDPAVVSIGDPSSSLSFSDLIDYNRDSYSSRQSRNTSSGLQYAFDSDVYTPDTLFSASLPLSDKDTEKLKALLGVSPSSSPAQQPSDLDQEVTEFCQEMWGDTVDVDNQLLLADQAHLLWYHTPPPPPFDWQPMVIDGVDDNDVDWRFRPEGWSGEHLYLEGLHSDMYGYAPDSSDPSPTTDAFGSERRSSPSFWAGWG